MNKVGTFTDREVTEKLILGHVKKIYDIIKSYDGAGCNYLSISIVDGIAYVNNRYWEPGVKMIQCSEVFEKEDWR